MGSALATASQSSVGDSNNIAIPRITSPPPIDGTLSDPIWQKAAKVSLGYDLRTHQVADQSTTAMIMDDGTYLYVGFDAKQSGAVRATQHSNNVGLDTDDEVQIDLWPGGDHGFAYRFIATPLGTHYQSSTENTAYEPNWESVGKITASGYSVTMRIPLKVLRGGNSQPWRLQFVRVAQNTFNDYVWSGGAAQGDRDDVTYAGFLTGMPSQAAARPTARFGIYGLGSIASTAIGGSTSRAGLDAAIPITPTASFIAAIHPDYSGVELDQQTIAPTAYQRVYNEVRPFFTQGANLYNYYPCVGCPGIQELYTPAIPTPRDGYAVEGKQGNLSFGAFDAVGVSRIDTAQSVHLSSTDRTLGFTAQRVSVDMPGFKDDNLVYSVRHDNLKNLFEYVNYGQEGGTLVTDANSAKRLDAGVGFYGANSFLGASLRKVGAQYDPYDGFVFHPDIAGFDINGSQTYNYNPKKLITRLILFGDVDRYHGSTGGLNQTDNTFAVGADLRGTWHVRGQVGSSYLRLSDGTFTPVSQNGLELYYHYGSSTPTALTYYTGRFGPGKLDSWTRSTTVNAGRRGTLTFEADNTTQWLDAGGRNTQWLERISYAYQGGRDSSLALGVRRIIGTPPLIGSAQLFQTGWNISAAYHKRLPHDELYLVYGDSSAFSTAPQFIMKWIHYIGAEKGT
ncbi:MAG: hypothetical protein M3Y21_09555 [Candidatus Eremiobacteraeota bacterium]|nr:hypothetical protein [Candidatus Eremiobacteraeota bacterium]